MVIRVSLTLDPVDVDLVDRLAKLQGLNRSETMRIFLAEARPMVRQTVELLESALRQRDQLLESFSQAELTGLSSLLPEMQKVQDAVMGSMSRLEGGLAAQQALDPRPSNHGGHTPTPSPPESQE